MLTGVFSENEFLKEVKNDQEIEIFLSLIKKERGKEKPIIIFTTDAGGLHIGIAEEFGFLNYFNVSNDPPYYSSVGNQDMDPLERLEDFFIMGHHSEISYRNCISFDILVKVVKEYFNTGKLSEQIIWEED